MSRHVHHTQQLLRPQGVPLLGGRRGLFGKSGLNAVDAKFKHQRYFGPLDGSEEQRGVRLIELIKSDAKHALRFNGPALFLVPTPEDCTVPVNHKDYIVCAPVFFLASQSDRKDLETRRLPRVARVHRHRQAAAQGYEIQDYAQSGR